MPIWLGCQYCSVNGVTSVSTFSGCHPSSFLTMDICRAWNRKQKEKSRSLLNFCHNKQAWAQKMGRLVIWLYIVCLLCSSNINLCCYQMFPVLTLNPCIMLTHRIGQKILPSLEIQYKLFNFWLTIHTKLWGFSQQQYTSLNNNILHAIQLINNATVQCEFKIVLKKVIEGYISLVTWQAKTS